MVFSDFIATSAASLYRGDTTADDSIKETSDILLKVGVTVISNEDCEEVNGKYNGKKTSYDGWITENMLCAIGECVPKFGEF